MDERSLEIPDDLANLHKATSFVRGICGGLESYGADKHFAVDVELAVSEACTNAIKHGSDSDQTKSVIISCCTYQDRLVINIRDQGKGFDMDRIPTPNFDKHPEKGYGVYIIKSKMDKVEYSRKGNWNQLSMTKFFKNNTVQKYDDYGIRKALVVDDDVDMVNLLKRYLEKQGMEVYTAGNGVEALEILYKSDVRLVLTDWLMPEMDGVSLCKKIRSSYIAGYTYIIFLTARGKKEDIVAGMEAGADDYLSKPVNSNELKVHINAGLRVLSLERTLLEKNEVIKKDLEGARELQKSFLPAMFPEVSGIEFAANFIPSAYVSGDAYNMFRLDEKQIGLYHIDVMGHGVFAALFSFLINQRLTHDLSPCGLIKVPKETSPYYLINSPEKVVGILNEEDLLDQYGSYFTMLYTIFNMETGVLSIYRAGHNPPLIVRANGDSEYVTEGGAPIGLGIPLMVGECREVQLYSGDALIVFSDGINECYSSSNPGECFGLERARDYLVENRLRNMEESFEELIENVKAFHGKEEFDDDVSIVGLRWKGH